MIDIVLLDWSEIGNRYFVNGRYVMHNLTQQQV
jgi:hypothetical protein